MTQSNGTQGNAVAAVAIEKAKPKTPTQILNAEFTKWKPTLEAILPKHLNADRIIKMAVSAYMRSDDLQKCTVTSVIKAVIQAAELGLEVGSLLGESYLLPFNTTVKVRDGNVFKDQKVTIATLVPGYKGLLKLARQSGEVSSISAYVVDEADAFQVTLGLNPDIQHTPNYDKRTGTLKAVYCVVRFKDGGLHFDVMTKGEVDAIRARSKSGGNGPWVTDFSAMAVKTVIKRTLKMVPLSPEKAQVAMAIAADNAAETGEAFNTEMTEQLDMVEQPAQLVSNVETSRTSKLNVTLAGKVADAEFDAITGEVFSTKEGN